MDKKYPLISIIFPSYNGEKFLNRNLDSIKKLSSINNIELIIVDNNSNDSSIKIIESYKNDIKIKLIKQEKNLGFAKACNIGARHAQGEFLFITNQDVIFNPTFFEKILSLYKTYKKENELIISPALVFEGDGIHYFGAKIHFLGFAYTPEVGQEMPMKKIIKYTQRFSGGTFFIKRKIFLEMEGFDSIFFMYYEDTDLSLRFLRNGMKILTTNDPYLIHQKHEWKFSDFQYYLLERNRFIAFIKNIDNFKKVFPFFILTECIMLFHAIITKKIGLRTRIYYELIKHIKVIKELRAESRKKADLLSYQLLSRKLDPILLGGFQENKIFKDLLRLFNSILKLV